MGSKEYSLNLREQQRERTRRLILEGALTLFAERGFNGAVVRDIAAEAGVNHAMVKYHFENKENLWKEAVRHLFQCCNEETSISENEKNGLSPMETTELFIRKYIRYCARHPEHARIMVQASIRDNKHLTWAIKQFISRQHDTMLSSISQGQEQGVWPADVSPTFLLYVTVSVSQSIFMLGPEVKKAHGIDMTSQQAIEDYADTVIQLLFRHKFTGTENDLTH